MDVYPRPSGLGRLTSQVPLRVVLGRHTKPPDRTTSLGPPHLRRSLEGNVRPCACMCVRNSFLALTPLKFTVGSQREIQMVRCKETNKRDLPLGAVVFSVPRNGVSVDPVVSVHRLDGSTEPDASV